MRVPVEVYAPKPEQEPVRNLRVTFWGVQGSLPTCPTAVEIDEYFKLRGPVTPGTTPPVYGGDTSCVEVESADGEIIVLDLGSGVRNFADDLLFRHGRKHRILNVFGTHQHLDHRLGLSFSAFCFVSPNPFDINIFGPRQFLDALDQRYGLFTRQVKPAMHNDDPLDYRIMTAKFTPTELRPGGKADPSDKDFPWPVRFSLDPIRIGSMDITPFWVYHGPTPCLAYKITRAGASFVYCTDHEHRRGADPNHPKQIQCAALEAEVVRQCQDVDLAYFDGQYLLEEYLGKRNIGVSPAISRLDWGHGCVEDIMDRSKACRIGRTLIGHHDPARTWPQLWLIDQELAAQSAMTGVKVELAKARTVVNI